MKILQQAYSPNPVQLDSSRITERLLLYDQDCINFYNERIKVSRDNAYLINKKTRYQNTLCWRACIQVSVHGIMSNWCCYFLTHENRQFLCFHQCSWESHAIWRILYIRTRVIKLEGKVQKQFILILSRKCSYCIWYENGESSTEDLCSRF